MVKKNKKLELSLFMVFSVATLFAFYFEYYLPKQNPRYTSDPIDIILYFSGAILYYIIEKSKTTKSEILK